MGHFFRSFFRCVSEIGEVVEIMDTPHSITDNSDKKLKVTSGHIAFEGVDFSYDRNNKVFEQLNFIIKPGERVGLV
ncbi:MAG: hypothetical protein LBH96_00145 [Candidatus Peribacteria bacterium]|jgi:ATP-binding cassette subfamily B protein|nr:hypothetical protein [Candidatus Peribacteria bacterium]